MSLSSEKWRELRLEEADAASAPPPTQRPADVHD